MRYIILFLFLFVCSYNASAQATLQGAKAKDIRQLQQIVQAENEKYLKKDLHNLYKNNKSETYQPGLTVDGLNRTYQESLNYQYSFILPAEKYCNDFNITAVRMAGVKLLRPDYTFTSDKAGMSYKFKFKVNPYNIITIDIDNNSKDLPAATVENMNLSEVATLMITKAQSNGKYYLIMQIKQVPDNISADALSKYPSLHTFTIGRLNK